MPHATDVQCLDQEWQRSLRLTGARLRKAREDSGLTQAELAGLLGYANHSAVSRWELGMRPMPLWALLSLSVALRRQSLDIAYPLHAFLRQILSENAPLNQNLYEICEPSSCDPGDPASGRQIP